jgi:hypothetical protein
MEREDLKKGMTVTYVPRNSGEDRSRREVGVVTSWNDSFVFVDYGTGTSKATSLETLMRGDETFVCENELNSVLDGAFGRCEKKCNNC